MNIPKWEELRLAMLSFERQPPWRTRDAEKGMNHPGTPNGSITSASAAFTPQSGLRLPHRVPSTFRKLKEALARLHVPGERTEDGFKVYGFIPIGKALDYVQAASDVPKLTPPRGVAKLRFVEPQ
jgi:hypothetical protein